MPEDFRLLTVKQVAEIAAISVPTVYRLVAAGRFPAQLKIGPQASRWRSDEVDAHIERLSAARAA